MERLGKHICIKAGIPMSEEIEEPDKPVGTTVEERMAFAAMFNN